MEQSAQILSDIIIYDKYAKYIPELNRRETWKEIVQRRKEMDFVYYEDKIRENPKIAETINYIYDNFVLPKKVLPSMRSLQYAGKPILLSPNRIFNCAYSAVDTPDFFHEAMFLLLGGSGLGYSVQFHHVNQLPEIRKPTKTRRFKVADSIEGWADAVKVLIYSYMKGRSLPRFDFSDIRPKGSPIKTGGGKAPGPEPLKTCLHQIQTILDRKKDGEKLTPLEVHDITCFIADAVLSGGVRRSALIVLFSFDDEEMITCKFGSWWELNPQRARANNSAVILRHRIKEKAFKKFFERIAANKTGDPNIWFSYEKDGGTNPCVEIYFQYKRGFCNLVTINSSNIESQEDFNERSWAATVLGTLQAGYTDFHYISEDWKEICEKESLLGVSMTGVASDDFISDINLIEPAEKTLEINDKWAAILGIKAADRICCIKPEGTSSLALGCSSGIHAWYAPYYIRRVTLTKSQPIYKYLKRVIPNLIEDSVLKPTTDAILSVPIKAPENSVTRDRESREELLNRVSKVHKEWIRPSHRKGSSTHNVSVTVEVEDNEWEDVGNWLWEHRNDYNAISFMPKNEKVYQQMPFEQITKEQYEDMLQYVKNIDLSKVVENEDLTSHREEVACAGNACEISSI